MRKILFAFAALLIIVSFYSCNKYSKAPNGGTDALSLADEEVLENTPKDTTISDSTIMLSNGMSVREYILKYDAGFYNSLHRTTNVFSSLGPEAAKNLIISFMTVKAWWLATRKNHQYSDEGFNKPAQNGLAYIWGGKDYTIREHASGGSTCNEELYGLDCSGLIYELFVAAQISSFPQGPAENQRKVSTIQNALIAAIPGLNNKIKVEDLGKISSDKWLTGDIIYWVDANDVAEHIGVILLNQSGEVSIVQSNGVPGTNLTECGDNNNGKRGPNILKPQNANWFDNGHYRIVRINADISGSWDLHLRCINQTNDFALLHLYFPADSISKFTLNQSYLDYNNVTTGYTILNFTYDNTTNLLSCIYSTTFSDGSSSRTDQFSIKLVTDTISYFPVDKVVDNTACTEAASLIVIK